MAVVTGDARWDGVGSLAIGTLLLCIAVFLAFEVSGLLVGESALPEQETAIRAALIAQSGVDSIIHMRTLHTGPDELLVAVKVGVRRDLPSSELAVVIDEAEQRVRDGGADGQVDLRRARHRACPGRARGARRNRA